MQAEAVALNVAENGGGGIFFSGGIFFENPPVDENLQPIPGALAKLVSTYLTMDNCEITGNATTSGKIPEGDGGGGLVITGSVALAA